MLSHHIVCSVCQTIIPIYSTDLWRETILCPQCNQPCPIRELNVHPPQPVSLGTTRQVNDGMVEIPDDEIPGKTQPKQKGWKVYPFLLVFVTICAVGVVCGIVILSQNNFNPFSGTGQGKDDQVLEKNDEKIGRKNAAEEAKRAQERELFLKTARALDEKLIKLILKYSGNQPADSPELIALRPKQISNSYKVLLSPDNKWVVGDLDEGDFWVWDSSNNNFRIFKTFSTIIMAMAFSPDGSLLAVAGLDSHVQLWDTTTWNVKVTIPKFSFQIRSLAFTPDNKSLVTGCEKYKNTNAGSVTFWNASTGQQQFSFFEESPCLSLAASSNGRFVASVHRKTQNAVVIWHVPSQNVLRTIHCGSQKPSKVAFSPDGWTLAVGCDGQNRGNVCATAIRLISMDPWNERVKEEPHSEPVELLTFTPDGKSLLIGFRDTAKADRQGHVLYNVVPFGVAKRFDEETLSGTFGGDFSAGGKVLVAPFRPPRARYAIRLVDSEKLFSQK